MPASTERSWLDHFQRNMNELGVPAPDTLFETVTTTIATIDQLDRLVGEFGNRVTIKELVHAGRLSDKLLVLGAMTAAGYAGAVAGSAFVATVRTMSGGAGIEDLFITIDELMSRLGFDMDFDPYMFNSPLIASRPIEAASLAMMPTSAPVFDDEADPVAPSGDVDQCLTHADLIGTAVIADASVY